MMFYDISYIYRIYVIIAYPTMFIYLLAKIGSSNSLGSSSALCSSKELSAPKVAKASSAFHFLYTCRYMVSIYHICIYMHTYRIYIIIIFLYDINTSISIVYDLSISISSFHITHGSSCCILYGALHPMALLQARQLAVDAALVVRPLLHQAAQPLALRLQAPELLAQPRDALVVRVDDLLELLDLPKSTDFITRLCTNLRDITLI